MLESLLRPLAYIPLLPASSAAKPSATVAALTNLLREQEELLSAMGRSTLHFAPLEPSIRDYLYPLGANAPSPEKEFCMQYHTQLGFL